MTRNRLALIALAAAILPGTILQPTARAEEDGNSLTGAITAKELNRAVGAPLFPEGNTLWEEPAGAVARRLGMPRESETKRQSSYRTYPSSGARFLGARPFSIALYGSGSNTARLSLVYANKGDFFASEGRGEAHFNTVRLQKAALRDFRAALKADEKAVSGQLSALLGEPDVQSFGEGKSRQRVKRWDWNGHAFLLGEEDEEYVSLQIEPAASADDGGKVGRSRDSAVRDRLRASVERRPNGDVVVGDLPMVDQGPKGYCVPATFERCMRHVDVPADMYLLAMMGDTGLGGSTNVANLVDAVERDVRRKGRLLKTFSGKLKISSIARYIDEGVPVIWSHCSTDAFNEIANRRTRERQSVSDWEAWTQKLRKEQRDARNLARDESRSHVAIIIGYNGDTGEVAISDSWGNAYRERWIGEKEADRVSLGTFVVIQP